MPDPPSSLGTQASSVSALLGNPQVLILDEPVNGPDAEGVRWVRTLLKDLAAEGRTVLLSSHLMSEMELTAEHLIVIGQGRLLADTSLAAFAERMAGGSVRVRSPEPGRLQRLILRGGVTVSSDQPDVLTVTGMESDEIGAIAGDNGIILYELVAQRASLEEAFLELTGGAVEYRSPGARPDAVPAGAGRSRS